MKKLVPRLCVILILVLAPWSWAIGGGAGGGHGGFGGGGGRSGSGGSRGNPPPILDPWSMGVLLAGVGMAIGWALLTNRRRLVTISLVLSNSDHYSWQLRSQLRKADFSEPVSRNEAFQAVISILEPKHIIAGYSKQMAVSFFHVTKLANSARRLWGEQIKAIDLEPSILNLENPEEHAYFIKKSSSQTTSQAEHKEKLCVVGLIAAVPCRSFFWSSGNEVAVNKALKTLHKQQPDAFYFFYAPENNGRLTREEAMAFLDKLRAVR